MRNKSKRNRRNKIAQRRTKRNVLVVCEGKTEEIYLKALKSYLKLSTANISLIAEAGGFSKTVEKARMLQEQRIKKVRKSSILLEYDDIWCVFDAENPNQHKGNLEKAYTLAVSYGFNCIISNPSFEIWFLWHFSNTGRYFTNGQEVKRALSEFINDYSEGMNIFPIVYPHTDKAMQRASNKLKVGKEKFPNPSTYVNLLLCKAFFSNQTVRILETDNTQCKYGLSDTPCTFCNEVSVGKTKS